MSATLNLAVPFKRLVTVAMALSLSSCSVVTLKPEAAHVRIAADAAQIKNCRYLGEVIGSEGHWYTFLFIANRTLMQAAMDDMRNQAAARGADWVLIVDPHLFSTSVTTLGLAYRCGNPAPTR